MDSTKILSSITVFNIDNNKKCTVNTKSAYKKDTVFSVTNDHVTLKTEVMAAKNLALPSQE